MIQIQNVNKDAFSVIVCHVYSNNQDLTADNVYDILEAAEMLLLPELKRQCGVFLADYLDVENVVDLCLTARLFDIPRLEHVTIEFMAIHIEEMVSESKFRELVTKDAKSVKNRQETDSIDVIDEIRFILKTDLRTISAIDEANRKLEAIDEMLEDMGFEI